MEKKKREIILIIILIPILGYFIYSNLLAPRKKKAPPPAAETEAEISPVKVKKPPETEKKEMVELPPLDEKLVQMIQEQNNIAEKPWGRDPFNPAPKPVEEAGRALDWKGFKLTGVVPIPTGGTATINREVIGVGEVYRGYRLIKVEISQITLEKEGQSYILTMPEE